MTPVENLLIDLDKVWKPLPSHPGKVPLRVIGSMALMLQVSYGRGTKDGDVLETAALTPEIQAALRGLAGQGTKLATRHRVYLDIVAHSLPFLPRPACFHPHPGLSRQLKNFEVEVLDITDVVVSKLIRFNANDESDVRAMAQEGHVAHDKLVARFRLAVEGVEMSAKADDLARCIQNLHRVEQDCFLERATPIRLPEWMED